MTAGSTAPPQPRRRRPPSPRGAGGWVSLGLLARVLEGLQEGWDRLPPGAGRRFWIVLAAGFVVAEAVALGLTAAVRAVEGAGRLAWEPGAVSAFAAVAPLSFNTAVWMDAVGNTAVLWTLVLVGAGAYALRRQPLPALALLVGHSTNFVLTGSAWLLWARDRPELVEGGIASPEGLFHSHPSGHLVQAVFVYGLLVAFWVRATRSRGEAVLAVGLGLAAMAVVAVARLRLGAHWPTDLLSAAAVGGVWLAAVLVALRRAEATVPAGARAGAEASGRAQPVASGAGGGRAG